MEQTQPSPFSLDALIRLAKKVTLLGMQGKPADLLISRDGKPLKLRIQLEWAR